MFKIASENLIFSEVGSHSDIYCKSHNKVGNLQVSSNQMERTQNMLLVQLWENLESKYYAPMSKINLQHILHMTSNICTYYLRFGGTGPFLEQTSFKRKSWRSSVDHLIFVAELILGDISQFWSPDEAWCGRTARVFQHFSLHLHCIARKSTMNP